MDQAPRDLHFSHGNTRFRAIFVDNLTGGILSGEECCICGYELNNLAYYTTEPPLFYAHVACALRPPNLSDILARLPSPELRHRHISSNQSNPYYPHTGVHHSYSFPMYVPNYAHHGPSPNNVYGQGNGSWAQSTTSSSVGSATIGVAMRSVLEAFLQALFSSIIG